jgi:hypothetical protein
MTEPMTVIPEVWPIAADKEGLWLVSGDGPWMPRLPVPADGEVHAEVELTLAFNGVDRREVRLLHSTSWRPVGTSIVLTYVAVVCRPGYVRENWSRAEPISPLLPGAVGKPLVHAAAAAPDPRDVDVLFHGLRHLAFLRDTDATAAAVLVGDWVGHLARFQPALAGMYGEEHREAA